MPKTTLNDAVSGDRAEQLASDLGHEKSRLAIQSVVKEYVGSSEFANRVEGIQLKALGSDPARGKLKDWVTGIIKTEIDAHATQKQDKKWGMIIGVGGLIFGALGVAVAIIALFVRHGG